MNVFEELIDELKAENLLEATVIDVKAAASFTNGSGFHKNASMGNGTAVIERVDAFTSAVSEYEPIGENDLPEIQKPADEKDFYRKRAMDEVSSLQMVEHVLSGVEREHMKIVSVCYDDLEAKKALHRFLQVSGDLTSPDHAETEYMLLQETEGWCSALSERDKNISVANIRRFCENSRPVLSSQALMALARFYRNSPYSESVRGKFDFVMTRLFARDTEEEKRRLLFSRKDMIGHIKTLYANWSSILLYSSEEDEAEISLAVSRFDDLSIEAECAETFDELLTADFFNKIRLFKEDLNEVFFVPEVVAAAIECNVRVGNKYVDLIHLEKERSDVKSIEEKYGYTYDQIVSNAAGKTLLLVDLLRNGEEYEEIEEAQASFDEVFPDVRRTAAPRSKKESWTANFQIFGMSKWVLAMAVVAIAVSIGLYFWAENATGGQSGTSAAKTIDISNSDIKEHILTARGSSESFYGVTAASWDALTEAQQKEFLQKVYYFAEGNGYKKVNLSNFKGRTVGYASKDRYEILNP